jgi:hypothetical protein
MIDTAGRGNRAPAKVIIAFSTIFVIGVLLMTLSHLGWVLDWVRHVPYVGGFLPDPDFLRDLGIAFVVAFIVGGLFEVRRSLAHQVETMRDVIDVTMGEQISPDVWLELKELIAVKQVIRRDVRIRLQLQRNIGLGEHEAILGVEYQYQIHMLTNKRAKVSVRHELDYQLRNDGLGLPRFERVTVTCGSQKGHDYSGPEIERISKKGCVELDLDLASRGAEPYVVRSERYELVHAPGSYNMYTPEFMKDLRVDFVSLPDDIEVEVIVRPQGKGDIKRLGNTWMCQRLILPGQGIEIKFNQREARSTQGPNNLEKTQEIPSHTPAPAEDIAVRSEGPRPESEG